MSFIDHRWNGERKRNELGWYLRSTFVRYWYAYRPALNFGVRSDRRIVNHQSSEAVEPSSVDIEESSALPGWIAIDVRLLALLQIGFNGCSSTNKAETMEVRTRLKECISRASMRDFTGAVLQQCKLTFRWARKIYPFMQNLDQARSSTNWQIYNIFF